MKNQSSLLRWTGICTLVLAVSVAFANSAQSVTPSAEGQGKRSVDLVTLSVPAETGKNEMPPAVFLHDLHTSALEQDGKTCATCHDVQKVGGHDKLVLSFKGTEGLSGDALKDTFHKGCISCHEDYAKQGKKTGPAEASCRSCHAESADYTTARGKVGFTKFLHNAHIAAPVLQKADGSDNCASCHHVGFDKEKASFVTKSGAEDTCFNCHYSADSKANLLKKNTAATDDFGPIIERKTSNEAAHSLCVSCHVNIAALGDTAKTGPVSCAGCHDAGTLRKSSEKYAADAALKNMRLKRNQPDSVLLFASTTKQSKEQSSMLPASFDHKFHESVLPSCSACHHKSLQSCSSCHTVEGSEKGGYVSQSTAMHMPTSARSCVGCHNLYITSNMQVTTEQSSCVACHSSVPTQVNQSSCVTCHSVPVGMTTESANVDTLSRMSKAEREQVASATIAQRKNSVVAPINLSQIPEQVTISILADEFEASTFPHRQIVKTLMEQADGSRLAGAFHTDPRTLCAGCHHKSPLSVTPPRCVSCHAEQQIPAPSDRPALKAAYHQQCMGCHERLSIKPAPTECSGCHTPRAK